MLMTLARDIVLSPRETLRRLLDLRLDTATRWQIFAVVVALSALGSHMFLRAVDRSGDLSAIAPSPLATVAVQALLLLLSAAAVFVIGRGFGGTARFPDALLAMSAVQGLMVAIQVVQLVALVISGTLAEILGILSVGLFFWILANFVMELHGFRSLGRVMVGMVVSFIAIAMVLGTFLGLAGLPLGVGAF